MSTEINCTRYFKLPILMLEMYIVMSGKCYANRMTSLYGYCLTLIADFNSTRFNMTK